VTDSPRGGDRKSPATRRTVRAVVSIREVAERSGVSVATVSRVLNGSTKVTPATTARVLAQARELDYVPNAAARTLVRQRSQLLGVVLDTGREHPDIQHPFFQEVLVGLKHRIGLLDYDLLLFANEEHGYLRRALHHQVDGLVLMSADPTDQEFDRLLMARLPTVAVDMEIVGARAGFVASDNLGGAALAVTHLHSLGHERIATIAGPLEHKSALDRLRGYQEALDRLGLPRRPEYLESGDFYTESGVDAGRRLLGLPEPPTAVFAASDLMALGVIQAARELRLRVPGDLAVVGFDDIQLAELVDPPLTTIRQDKRGLGSAAGEAVVALIESGEAPPPRLVLPVELVVRRSTGGV
jgi:LacI family transcriptional regulator, galactose operon repressor